MGDSMVERVARALRAAMPEYDGLNQDQWRDMARAAIEAMREPTETMLHDAFVAMNETPSGTWKAMKAAGTSPRCMFDVKMAPRYRAMITAALKDTGAG